MWCRVESSDAVRELSELFLAGVRAGIDVHEEFARAATSATRPNDMSTHALLTEAFHRALRDARWPRPLPLETCHLRNDVGGMVSALAAARVAGLPVLDGEVFPLGASTERLGEAIDRLGGAAFAIGASALEEGPSAQSETFANAIRAHDKESVKSAVDRVRALRTAVALVQPDPHRGRWGMARSAARGCVMVTVDGEERLAAVDEPLSGWMSIIESIVGGPAQIEFARLDGGIDRVAPSEDPHPLYRTAPRPTSGERITILRVSRQDDPPAGGTG